MGDILGFYDFCVLYINRSPDLPSLGRSTLAGLDLSNGASVRLFFTDILTQSIHKFGVLSRIIIAKYYKQ